MKVSWIKLDHDKKSFRLPENLGFNVISLQDNDDIDKKIDELILDKYNTIILLSPMHKNKILSNISSNIIYHYLY